MKIDEQVVIDFRSGLLHGAAVRLIERRMGELEGVFHDEGAWRSISPDHVVYRVQTFLPVPEGTEGGLFWGTTTIESGRVGDEYFMTKGHLHRIRNRGEYYVTAAGSGALLLMDEVGETRIEWMRLGSLHYIPAAVAHRVANVGSEPLSFLACWPSDAGHDYESIRQHGFSARLVNRGGEPALVSWKRR